MNRKAFLILMNRLMDGEWEDRDLGEYRLPGVTLIIRETKPSKLERARIHKIVCSREGKCIKCGKKLPESVDFTSCLVCRMRTKELTRGKQEDLYRVRSLVQIRRWWAEHLNDEKYEHYHLRNFMKKYPKLVMLLKMTK